MSIRIQRRRGTTAQHKLFTGADGELTVDTDRGTVVVHDGVTQGGSVLAREPFKDVPSLLASEHAYQAGDRLIAGLHSYSVDAADALDSDLENEGGAKMKVVPADVGVSIIQCGAKADGTDDSAAYAVAVSAANRENVPVHVPAWATIYLPAGTHPMPHRGFAGGGRIKGAAFSYNGIAAPSSKIAASGTYEGSNAIASPVQGATSIAVVANYAAGDVVMIRDNTGVDADNRMEYAVVAAATGSAITLNAPLKYTYGAGATVRRVQMLGPWSDGGCTFEDMFLDFERFNGVEENGRYLSSRVYHSETLNLKITPIESDARGANVWCGLSNGCRIGTIRGHFQNVNSDDPQGYVKLNCGIHDVQIDISASGQVVAGQPQSAVHIDTYFENNSRIDMDCLPCSNILARANAVGMSRSIYAVSNPTLTAGAEKTSWDIVMEGAGANLSAQGISNSRIVALTRDTKVNLDAPQNCDVFCHERPAVTNQWPSGSGIAIKECRVNFFHKPTIAIEGDTAAGACTYSVQRARTEYRNGRGYLTATVKWTGHTGTGDMLIKVTDCTPINNVAYVSTLLGGHNIPAATVLEFSNTLDAATTTPTNIFKMREAIGGALIDVPAAGSLTFTASWDIGLFGTT